MSNLIWLPLKQHENSGLEERFTLVSTRGHIKVHAAYEVVVVSGSKSISLENKPGPAQVGAISKAQK